jgi:hypothetical protein
LLRIVLSFVWEESKAWYKFKEKYLVVVRVVVVL